MDKMWFGLSILVFFVVVFIAIIVACLKSPFSKPTGEFKEADDDED